MGGDLNLKKSWHPHLLKNQRRVYEEEKSALDERKKIEALRKEREQEREIETLRKLQEASGGKIATARVDWMYAGPAGDGNQVDEEKEAYLLGKRRIDTLLKAKESTASLQKGAAVGIEAINSNANTARDTQKKVLEDPLLLIQKQKMALQIQAAKEARKNAEYEEKRVKEREKKRKHRHHHRDRSRSADYDRDRGHHKSRREERDGRDRHHRRSRSRSRSPYHKSHRDHRRRRSRSRSPREHDDRHDRDDRRRQRTPPRRSHDERRRSRSPAGRDVKRRDRTPPRRSHDDRRGSRDSRSPPENGRSRRQFSTEEKPRRPRSPPSVKNEAKENMADKLAMMQADASSLEDQRNERVRLREAEDRAEEERQKKTMEGGRRLINGMRNKAADMDLGDVLARGRGGLVRNID